MKSSFFNEVARKPTFILHFERISDRGDAVTLLIGHLEDMQIFPM